MRHLQRNLLSDMAQLDTELINIAWISSETRCFWFFPVLNHGEAAMLYCLIFLYIFAAGPGVWSVTAGSWGAVQA